LVIIKQDVVIFQFVEWRKNSIKRRETSMTVRPWLDYNRALNPIALMKQLSHRHPSLSGCIRLIAALIVLNAGALSAKAASVVGLWRFNEGTGTNISDSSGLGNNGTLQGTSGILPTWTASMPGFGGALLFTNDSTNYSYVNIPASASLQIGQTATDPWTITAWAYELTNDGGGYIATYGRIVVIDDGVALQLESGATNDSEFYTWDRTTTAWQIGWGPFATVNPLFDQWEHWAVVYDGTNIMVYLNGNQGTNGGFAFQAVTAALAYSGYQGSVIIGSELDQLANRNWCGMLDDVAIFSGALTQAQIATVMSGDFSEFQGGPARILTEPQKQTVPAGSSASFTVGATGQAPIQYQWFQNGFPLAAATNATLNLADVQTAQAGSYTVSVTNSVGGQVSGVAPLIVYNPETTLVGLWRFNEGSGTNAADSSGLGNDGVLTGDNGASPGWAPSLAGFGDALSLTNDGVNNTYVDIPGNNSLMIGETASNAWSITAWAYESSDGTSNFVSTYGRIVVIDDGTALQLESGAISDDEFYTWSRANPAWQVYWGTVNPSVDPLLDQWVHWAVTYDGTNLTLYRNGNQGPNGGVASVTTNAPLSYPGYLGAFRIGSELGAGPSRNWNGYLDDVAVFTTALTQSQIQTIMTGDFSAFATSPTLSIAVNSTNATLSWPLAPVNFQLQSATNLENAVWQPVATAVTNGDMVSVAAPITSGNQFFRLMKH
jgi:Concanavalin A-like lectin/glucanases superfamily/Immunoglobulin I-set domain